MTKVKIIQSYLCKTCKVRHFRGGRNYISHLQRSQDEEIIEEEQTDLVSNFGFPNIQKKLKIGGK